MLTESIAHEHFTASKAVEEFKRYTGYEFHPTVPGQLLRRRGISGIGFDEEGRRAFCLTHWGQLWQDMLALAIDRGQYGEKTMPRVECAPIFCGGNTVFKTRKQFGIPARLK